MTEDFPDSQDDAPDDVKESPYHFLEMDDDALKISLADPATILKQAAAYLKFVRRHKGFSAPGYKKEYLYNRYVPENAIYYKEIPVEIPQFQPKDLIRKVGIVAKNNMIIKKEKEIHKLREVFSTHAHNLIAEIGNKKMQPQESFALDYMLRGAMKNFKSEQTLEQNATQFEFEREQHILKKTEKHHPKEVPTIKPVPEF